MSCQKFKQKRDEIESKIYQGNYFIDEYEELTKELLLYIKEKYRKFTRDKEVSDMTIDDQEEGRWLSQFFTLDK